MDQEIKACVDVLKRGGLILYPTDTIWGIGCDATNENAVRRVYELKRREESKALIVLLDDEQNLDHYVVDVPMMARELLAVAVKPLTIVYEGAYNLAPSLLGENDSVGIRVSHEEFSHRLCAAFGRPIVSTSANVSGTPAAKTFDDIAPAILEGVDYVVNYRRDDTSPHDASNVILLRNDGTFKIIR
ncbi:MAG: threonylcarbamoyl-AMP synthase [Muribaculaceae bacterium]|nr:threonylcarbamoyl-AMP synthase [Muribaculaceae bacterium]